MTIYQVVLKGYHECPFAVEIGERFVTQKKRGDCGNALKVGDDRGQLGHLQIKSDLVTYQLVAP